MIKQVIQLTIIVTAALYCSMAGAHGKVSMDEDTCTRRLDDDSMVHLSAYQPQHEPSNQYCTEIPREGDTLLVIDLADQALRDIPVGIRVVRGTSEVDDETVAYLRPSYHPDGVMRERPVWIRGYIRYLLLERRYLRYVMSMRCAYR